MKLACRGETLNKTLCTNSTVCHIPTYKVYVKIISTLNSLELFLSCRCVNFLYFVLLPNGLIVFQVSLLSACQCSDCSKTWVCSEWVFPQKKGKVLPGKTARFSSRESSTPVPALTAEATACL